MTVIDETCTTRAVLTGLIRSVVEETPGAVLEVRPASLAVHVRGCLPPVAQYVLAELRARVDGRWGVRVTEDEGVIELATSPHRA